MLINATSDYQGSIMDIMNAQSSISQDSRHSNKVKKELHYEKKMNMLDSSIESMKEQQTQLKQAASKGFIFGLISNVLQIATVVVSIVFPPLAPVLIALSAIVNTIQQKMVSKDQLAAGEAQTTAESKKNQAESEARLSSMAEENMNAEKETNQLIQNRLEAALNHIQQSQSAPMRV